jgi:hypothetical protein
MVPYLVKYFTLRFSAISRMKRLRTSAARAGSAIGSGLVPRVTTALTRLEPITAPRPERAAIRPWSLSTPPISESFSAAGRMTEACDFG